MQMSKSKGDFIPKKTAEVLRRTSVGVGSNQAFENRFKIETSRPYFQESEGELKEVRKDARIKQMNLTFIPPRSSCALLVDCTSVDSVSSTSNSESVW